MTMKVRPVTLISLCLIPDLENSTSWLFVTSWIYSRQNYPCQNTGVGRCSLLQGIFPTQRLIPGLPHCRWILYQLSHQGSPKILEWEAYPFSRGPSQLRNQTGVSGNPRILDWAAYQFSRGPSQLRNQAGVSGSPRILDWAAYPFSRGSSKLRNQTGVSSIGDGFFTTWATREAHLRSFQ